MWPAVAPGRAEAAIALVSARSAANASGSSSEVIAQPAGVTSGEVLVAIITAGGTGAITPPSGWTVIRDTTTTLRQTSYYHVTGTSEPTSWTWTLGSARLASGGIIAYSGVDIGVPIDASATGSGTTGNAIAPSVTTNFAGDTVVAAVGYNGTWPSNSVTPGASTTERYDISNAGTESEGADFTQSTAGATATKTLTPVTSGAWIATAIALDPASAATLSLSTTATPTFSASLPSGDQSPTYSLPLSVVDTRTGSAAGWSLTITSTQFTTGGATPRTLATTASRATAVASACAGGASCVSPTDSVTYPLTVPAGSTPPSAVKLDNAAAGTGSGIFIMSPTISVSVPANSYAGTYNSTLTVALVSGP
jgi:WxL domain surface cell wall-binding